MTLLKSSDVNLDFKSILINVFRPRGWPEVHLQKKIGLFPSLSQPKAGGLWQLLEVPRPADGMDFGTIYLRLEPAAKPY